MQRLRSWALVAAGAAAISAVAELVRLIAGGALHGYTPLATYIASGILIPVLAVAAVGLALHRRFGWVWGVMGAIFSLGHGVVVLMGGTPAGAGYLVTGVVMLAGLMKSLAYFRITAEAT